MSTARLMQMGAAGIGYHPRPVINVGDVFSTDLYSGTGSAQTITNGIDLGEGGLVWLKARSAAQAHGLFDTERTNGIYKFLQSQSTSAEFPDGGGASGGITPSLNGFTRNSTSYFGGTGDGNGFDYASWTFRKAPKFFDVVTVTATATQTTFSHNLGVEPAFIIIKMLNAVQDWFVYHRSTGASQYLNLNKTNAQGTYSNWCVATDTTVTVRSGVMGNSNQYVAYLFAHNDGDGEFGPSYDQDIITCSSYTGNGSSQTVDCNFTSGAKFVLIKRTDSTGDWYMWDAQRGIVPGNDPFLKANTSGAEVTTDDSLDADATGFIVNQNTTTNINVSSANYIFCAIA